MLGVGLLHSVALAAIKVAGRRYEIGDELPLLPEVDLAGLGDLVAPGVTAEQVEGLIAEGRLPADTLARLDAGETVEEIEIKAAASPSGDLPGGHPQAGAESLAGPGPAGEAGGTAPASHTDTPDDANRAGASDGPPGGADDQAPEPEAAADATRTEPPPPASETVSPTEAAPAANAGGKGKGKAK